MGLTMADEIVYLCHIFNKATAEDENRQEKKKKTTNFIYLAYISTFLFEHCISYCFNSTNNGTKSRAAARYTSMRGNSCVSYFL